MPACGTRRRPATYESALLVGLPGQRLLVNIKGYPNPTLAHPRRCMTRLVVSGIALLFILHVGAIKQVDEFVGESVAPEAGDAVGSLSPESRVRVHINSNARAYPPLGSSATDAPFAYRVGSVSWDRPAAEASGLPSSRMISSSFPTGFGAVSNVHSQFMTAWTLFVLSDLMDTRANISDISVPLCDRRFDVQCQGGKVMEIPGWDTDEATAGKMRSVNPTSGTIDASQLYGSDANVASALRTGVNGTLTVDPRTGFPPLRSWTVSTHMLGANNASRFLLADDRGNAIPHVALLHVAFVREHNHRCHHLAARHPDWDDERLFQEARAWVIAVIQRITFTEFLIQAMGWTSAPPYSGFNASVSMQASIATPTLLAPTAFSLLGKVTPRLTPAYEPNTDGPVLLRDTVLHPVSAFSDLRSAAAFARGMVASAEGECDANFDSSFLDGGTLLAAGSSPMMLAADVAAAAIARGRREGLPRYGAVRAALGLPAISSWEQLVGHAATNVTTGERAALLTSLKSMYGSDPGQADAWVGSLIERKGSYLGDVLAALLWHELRRARSSDPFWYERPGALLNDEALVEELRSTRLSTVLTRTLNMAFMPSNAFVIARTALTGITLCGELGETCEEPQGFEVQLTPRYQMRWRVRIVAELVGPTSAPTAIQFELIFQGLGHGWMGVGFDSTDMTDVDIIIVFVGSSGTVWAIDMWSIGDKPRFDSELGSPDNIDRASLAGSVKDGVTTVSFQRPLDTGDHTRDAVIRSGRMDVIFAWSLQPVQPGVDGGMAYHGATRGTISVDFFSGSSSCGSVGATSTIQLVHGMILFTAWCVIAPVGIIAARYFRHENWWLKYHSSLLKVAAGGALPMIFSIVIDVQMRTIHLHSVLGLALSALTLLQSGIGARTQYGLKHEAHHPYHLLFRLSHRWLGRSMLVIAVYNCRLGIDRMFPDDSSPWAFLRDVMTGWISFVAFVFVVLELHLRILVPILLKRQHRALLAAGSTGDASTKTQAGKLLSYTWNDITQRVRTGAKLVVVGGLVVDLGDWVDSHPGGGRVLRDALGTDVSAEFKGEAQAAPWTKGPTPVPGPAHPSFGSVVLLAHRLGHPGHSSPAAGTQIRESGVGGAPSRTTPTPQSSPPSGSHLVQPLQVAAAGAGTGSDSKHTQRAPHLDELSRAKSLFTPAGDASSSLLNAAAKPSRTASLWSSLGLRQRTSQKGAEPQTSATQSWRATPAGSGDGTTLIMVGSAESSNRRQYRKRAHRHSAAAWRKLHSMVVGRLVSDDVSAGPSSLSSDLEVKPSSHGHADGSSVHSTSHLLRSSTTRRHAADDYSGGRGSDRALKREVEMWPVLHSSILDTVENVAALSSVDHYLRYTLTRREVLTCGAVPIVHFRVSAPADVHVPTLLPGLHYTFQAFNGPQLVERQYTPMLVFSHHPTAPVRVQESEPVDSGANSKPRHSRVHPIDGQEPQTRPTRAPVWRQGSGIFGDMQQLNADQQGQDPAPPVTTPFAQAESKQADTGAPAPPPPRELDFFIKLYPGGLMSKILNDLEVGAELKVRGPQGTPLLCATSASGCFHHIGLIAGGAGITPMLQLIDYFMAYSGLDTEIDCKKGTRVSLLYANSSADDLSPALTSQLEKAKQLSDSKVQCVNTLSKPPEHWAGERGRVNMSMLRRYMPLVPGLAGDDKEDADTARLQWCDLGTTSPATTRIFVCGPPSFADAVSELLMRTGVPREYVTFLE